MNHFFDIAGSDVLKKLLETAKHFKTNPFSHQNLGKNKTLGLLFFNASLRTRISTQKAANHLGLNTIVLDIKSDTWNIEFEDGVVMDSNKVEHVKEFAGVLSTYCDIVGIRAFAKLEDKKADDNEHVFRQFMRYSKVPIVNLESATRHPLQALADALTIQEYSTKPRPKVVLTWSPHPKPLPQAVGNSFANVVKMMDVDFVISYPKGFELNDDIIKNCAITHNQEEAFKDADFIYAKSWTNYTSQNYKDYLDWCVDENKMLLTNKAKFMHCLPVRRNVVVADEVLDSEHSLIIQQAENRVYTAQAVLKSLL